MEAESSAAEGFGIFATLRFLHQTISQVHYSSVPGPAKGLFGQQPKRSILIMDVAVKGHVENWHTARHFAKNLSLGETPVVAGILNHLWTLEENAGLMKK
jgi:hypothetical protein